MNPNDLAVTAAWTPDAIAKLLRDNTHSGTLVLNRQLLPELGQVLLQVGPTDLTLSQATDPAIKGRTVSLTGTSAFLAMSGTVTLSIAVPLAGPLEIYLSANSPAWKFADAFPGVLPKYTAFVDERSLEPQDSFFNGLTVDTATLISADYKGVSDAGVAFVPGLNLAGKLPLAGTPLEPVSFIIPPGGLPLSLAGTIAVQGAGKPPAIDLHANIPGLSFDLLGQLRLDPVSLWLEVRLGPEDPESRVSLASTLTLGSLQPLIISTALLQGDFVWVFEAIPTGTGQLKNGLQDLAGLAGPFFGDLKLPP